MLGPPNGGACDARKSPGTLPHHRMLLGAPRVGRHLIPLCPPYFRLTRSYTHIQHIHTFTCIYSSHTHRRSPAVTQSDTLLSPDRAELLPTGSKPGPAPVTLCHFVLQLCSLSLWWGSVRHGFRGRAGVAVSEAAAGTGEALRAVGCGGAQACAVTAGRVVWPCLLSVW